MSSDEESVETSQLYNYALVRFVHRGKKRKIEEIDIVPSKWLNYDSGRGRCTTKYLPPSSDPEDYEVLHDMVKLLADAPQSYTSYSIEIKGRAKTYKEALKKLNQLKYDEHVFSLESEDSASEMKKKIEYSVKQQDLQREAKKMQHLMEKSANELENEEEDTSTTVIQKNKISKPSNNSVELKKFSQNSNLINNIDTIAAPSPPTVTKDPSDIDGHVYDHFKENQVNELMKMGVSFTSKGFESDVIASLELPVISIQNLKCSSQFESTVVMYLDNLTKTVENVQKTVENIHTNQKSLHDYLLDKRVVNILNKKVDFAKKYELEIPFSTKQLFEQFNEELKTNQFLKNDVCYELLSFIDKDFVLTKSYVNMLKKFVKKNVAIQYSAVRASTDKSKFQFRGNEFSRCMDVVVCGTRADKGLTTDEKEMISALSSVLCNVKKWAD